MGWLVKWTISLFVNYFHENEKWQRLVRPKILHELVSLLELVFDVMHQKNGNRNCNNNVLHDHYA